MPKLTDRQLVILSAAARSEGGAVLPLPKSLKLNRGAATSVLNSLVKRGLVTERPAGREAEAWREAEDGRRMTLVITEAGLEAIGVEPEPGSGKPAAAAKIRPKTRGGRATRKPIAAKSKGKAARTTRKPTAAKPKGKAAPAARSGTKQALLIDLLERKKGATIAEAVEATGWQPHSVRGAISGTLKKKLGLTVTSTTVEGRGRVYRIAGRG